jgi:hypothetical protein
MSVIRKLWRVRTCLPIAVKRRLASRPCTVRPIAKLSVRSAAQILPPGKRSQVLRLARAGRGNHRRSVRGFVVDLFSNPAYQPYDLSAEQVFLAEEMRVNRDPFDALICAAARDLALPIVTRDGDIRSSGVLRVIW